MLLHADGLRGGDVTSKWEPASTGGIATSSPRFAGGAYLVNGTVEKVIPATGEVFLSGAFYFSSTTAATLMAVYADTGTVQHVTLTRNTSGKLEVRRGNASGTVLATSTATLTASTWVHVEARIVIHDTTGVVQVRLDDAGTNEISYSGDTRNGGTSTSIDKVTFSSSLGSTKATDLAIVDTTGSRLNSWLRNTTVVTVSPDGDGTHQDGVPTTAGPHYQLVNAQPWPSFGGVVLDDPQQETYTVADVLAPYDVHAVQVNVHANTMAGDTCTAAPLLRIAGADYTGSTLTLGAPMGTLSQVLAVNPATSNPWTTTSLGPIEAGLSCTDGGADGILLNGISMEVLLDLTSNNVEVGGGGGITVDVPNDVDVGGGGYIVAAVANLDAGAVVAGGGGSIDAGSLVTDYPLAPPADPTLTIPDLPPIRRSSETWDAPTLVDGVPQGWGPS